MPVVVALLLAVAVAACGDAPTDAGPPPGELRDGCLAWPAGGVICCEIVTGVGGTAEGSCVYYP